MECKEWLDCEECRVGIVAEVCIRTGIGGATAEGAGTGTGMGIGGGGPNGDGGAGGRRDPEEFEGIRRGSPAIPGVPGVIGFLGLSGCKYGKKEFPSVGEASGMNVDRLASS